MWDEKQYAVEHLKHFMNKIDKGEMSPRLILILEYEPDLFYITMPNNRGMRYEDIERTLKQALEHRKVMCESKVA